MRNDNQLHIRVNLKRLFQCDGIHIPGVALSINENGLAVLIGDRINARIKGHIRREDLFPRQSPRIGFCLPIELFACQFGCKVQRRGTAGKADSILYANVFGDSLLHGVDICADGADPVGADRFVHPTLFIPVHRGAGQPYFSFKRFDPGKARIRQVMVHQIYLL